MQEVLEGLYVGSDSDCNLLRLDSKWAVVHACKTCHQRGVSYRGNLRQTHPDYLVKESLNQLYLNMVDMDETLKPKYTHPIMAAAMRFIDDRISRMKILVHCNQGHSRAPSIALVYMARRGAISRGSYIEARKDFVKKYPLYLPATGIGSYLRMYWDELLVL